MSYTFLNKDGNVNEITFSTLEEAQKEFDSKYHLYIVVLKKEP